MSGRPHDKVKAHVKLFELCTNFVMRDFGTAFEQRTALYWVINHWWEGVNDILIFRDP